MGDATSRPATSLPDPRRAVVTPRVRTSPTSGALPLEKVVRGFLDAAAKGDILVHAPAGGGKTVALEHLRAALGATPHVAIHDEPAPEALAGEYADLLVVAYRVSLPGKWLAVLELAPWGEDEWIEYLAATHRDRCASVLDRLRHDDSRDALRGSPQLWQGALDVMAADDSVTTAREALRRHLSVLLPDVWSADAAGAAALYAVVDVAPPPRHEDVPDAVRALLRHAPVRSLLAADHLVLALSAGNAVYDLLVRPLPADLLDETGAALRDDPVATRRLESILRGVDDRQCDATAASLLLAADPTWHPGELKGRLLRRAVLSRASWPGVNLAKADLIGASLLGANLADADLSRVVAANADFSFARLTNASLAGATASDALFTGAALTGCGLRGARLWNTRFDDADLEGVDLREAELDRATFARGRLRGAIFHRALLSRTTFDDADLSRADFSGAALTGVNLREAAALEGASFRGASLLGCDLEGVALPAANFGGARLDGSLLTGSSMPGANFRNARLTNTGLAEIDWPGADLCGADLTGASFHMGSTRSGLVGSPVAGEGTRTGFYTDDYRDQDFKAPEEIRKANLCGADLTGALVAGVDFYLVDLRGAIYTPDQRAHFARCGAILHSRVA